MNYQLYKVSITIYPAKMAGIDLESSIDVSATSEEQAEKGAYNLLTKAFPPKDYLVKITAVNSHDFLTGEPPH